MSIIRRRTIDSIPYLSPARRRAPRNTNPRKTRRGNTTAAAILNAVSTRQTPNRQTPGTSRRQSARLAPESRAHTN